MKRFSIAAAVALLLGFAAPASAALITGHITFSGSAILDVVGKNSPPTSILDFRPPAGTGSGTLTTNDDIDGYFASLNITGTPPGIDAVDVSIFDHTNDLALSNPVTGPKFIPENTPIGVNGVRFIDKFVDANPTDKMKANDLHFDLKLFFTQPGPACVGPIADGFSCTIGGFLLTQTSTGVRVDWDYFGTWVNTKIDMNDDGDTNDPGETVNDSGDYIGSFNATLANYTVGEVLTRVANGEDIACGVNRNLACGITGNFDPVPQVPEPATLLLFGAGSGLLALRRRKAAGL
jgi:hypothetical protein